MSSFLQAKKARAANSGSLVDKLNAAKAGGGQSFKDDRFYYPERDATGNGTAIIRFLPAPPDNDVEFVKVLSHGFKNASGKWFIENCPTTLGHDCPVCSANSEVYNRSQEEYKRVAAPRKRKTTYISNILVVKDPKHPENNGKVFLFKYGSNIFDMISAKANPPEAFGDKPVDVFSWDDGANFNLRITKKDGNTNYDSSKWEDVSAVADGDADAQEAIWKKEYDLRPFVAEKEFKSFEELEKKFNQALGNKTSGPKTAEDVGEESAPAPSRSSAPKSAGKTAAPVEEEQEEQEEQQAEEGSEQENDPVAYFRKLAGGKK